uniref:NAD(P)-binding domain-containing protein n=1 Tax=Glycine max TaxID=3847 RepID=A0A0R0JI14_SOYBN
MRTVLSRLIHSTPSISRINAVSIRGRDLFFPNVCFKVEEAVNVPPPPTEKVVLFGGDWFVGSHFFREALERGMSAGSPSRDDGRSSLHDSWARNFAWYQGNLFSTATLRKHLNGATAVISFMGGFGSNIKAIRAASDQGVKRFVYISAAECGVVNDLLQGCNIGKRAAETELLNRFPFGGVILRPGLIYETRIAAVPLEMVLRVAKQSNHIPLVGPPLTPPVSVTAVAKVAVTAATATDPVFPPGIIDAYGIRRLLSE